MSVLPSCAESLSVVCAVMAGPKGGMSCGADACCYQDEDSYCHYYGDGKYECSTDSDHQLSATTSLVHSAPAVVQVPAHKYACERPVDNGNSM